VRAESSRLSFGTAYSCQGDDREMQTDVTELGLRVGELVEVRSEQEILATLDEHGRLDAMPFMPEMLQFCGKRFRVDKRAFKTCDQVNNSGMYRVDRAVHLGGARCDGQAHGGCQAACLLYWKEAWLKRVEPDGQEAAADAPVLPAGLPRCTIAALRRETRPEGAAADEERFSCQATEMPKAAPTHIRAWDVRQYVQDVTSRNTRLWPTIRSVVVLGFNKFQRVSRRLPRRLRIHGGAAYPFIDSKLNGKTPKELLDLQPGELVEVKSKEEIFATLDQTDSNRGLRFDVEGLRYCGRRARVLARINKLIDDKTGKMIHIPGDCIVLDGFICAADFHQNCPRGIYEYWREIWLRRVE
jgi:hypothetical protein